ncbi:MAG: phage tail protein [Rhodobacteraceae bacterium]|nr:phage tail protein [Paracoccaceae bacterium]
MADAFTPPKPASVSGYNYQEEAGVNRAQFEGNYSQRSGSGPNAWQGRVKLSWRNLTLVQLDAIRGFIRPRNGRAAFLYQVPGTSAPELWTCPNLNVRPERNKQHWAIALDLVRENDL